MCIKTIVSTILLVFVAASVGYLVMTETRSAEQPAKPAVAVEATPAVAPADSVRLHKVIAYYLHNTQRCRTCLKIEQMAKDALQAEFPDLLESGEVEWQVLNMEDPSNQHLATDYGLVTSSLVIVELHDGQQQEWVNMSRVWELVHDDEAAFREYVSRQVRAYLES
jgi:DUF971 family protein